MERYTGWRLVLAWVGIFALNAALWAVAVYAALLMG